MTSGDLINHWSEMPEWHGGRRLWAVYFTFPDEDELHRAVRRYQDAIVDVPGIDLIDVRWLHLTLQGIAFVDEVDRSDVDEIFRRLAATGPYDRLPVSFTTLPPAVDHDAITLTVLPGDVLADLRADVAATIRGVLGKRTPYRLPEPVGGFRPHISIAYSNRDVPGAELTRRLSAVVQEPVALGMRHLSVLELRREQPRWFWTSEHRVPLLEGAGRHFAE